MSQADELLNDLVSDSDISVQLADPTIEPHIVIGDDRFISVPKELQRIAVQYDHDVETVTFDCPRYWDGLDMSQLSIYINYMRKDREVACYKATDITVDDVDANIMHFNWTISRNVSEVKGELKFLVCIKKGDEDGNEVNHWNSELNTEMYISEGLEVEPSIFDPYPDIIGQWEDEVQRVKDILLAARDSGELDGATFTPSVDADGNLSWTNDRGRNNPATVNIKGYSPTILVREIEGGKQLIITDNRQSQTITIMDGADGYSPAILVREIDGGKQLVITDSRGSQTVDILNGTDGKDGTNGTNGENGYSPRILVRTVDGGHQLVITDYSGSQTVDVMDGTNGTNGKDGINGTDGYSPTVTTQAIANGTRITITDKDSSKSIDILNGDDGADGVDGYSPTVTTETVTDGIKVTITDKNGAKTFTLLNGTNGTNGQDGVSPTITITDINGGHRVTVTDKDGSKSFDVMDGTTEISEAVKDYIDNYMYIGEVEPTSGPVLWFDTSATSIN